MIIDSHQHFWDLNRKDCEWPTSELPAIYKNFGVEEYRAARAESKIGGSVLVQSQPNGSDTDYILELAKNNNDILAVVGWVDLANDNAPNRIRVLAQHPKFRGVRPMLQAIDEAAWILGEELQAALDVVQDCNLCFDALVQERHLKVLLDFVSRYPRLKIVLDHGAKPNIAANAFADWAEGIEPLAKHENVYCKISGLLTEAAPEQLITSEVFLPYFKHLYSCFGAERLMWGSDWPVLNLVKDLQSWLDMSQALFRECGASDNEIEAIYTKTARLFYGLN